MKQLFSSCVIAFSTYSRIPMPQVEWNEKNMRHTLAFFPLVGAAVGLIFWLVDVIGYQLGLGMVLRSALLTAVPVVVTGGIHLDGYCDTVDALASRRMGRVCATVQLSDTGIVPGSGVGNHRAALNAETLGVPVIALGVPTVVDAATLAADLLEESGVEQVDEDKLRENGTFMVTTRDIDQQVRDLAKVVGYGINWALQDLEIEEINALLS